MPLVLCSSVACNKSQHSAIQEEWTVELDCPPQTKRVEKKEEVLPEFFCIGENGKQGPWKEFDNEKRLLVVANFVDDRLEGPWTRYASTGEPELQGQYLNNMRTGLWKEWYVDGTKRSEKEYLEGMEHGYTKVWYRNGKLMAEGQYVQSLEEGPWKVYNPEGKLARECTMIQGVETDCIVHDKDFEIKSRKNESNLTIRD